LRVGQHKVVAPERVLHPGCAKPGDMHPQSQVLNADSFEHGVRKKQQSSMVQDTAEQARPGGVTSPHLGIKMADGAGLLCADSYRF